MGKLVDLRCWLYDVSELYDSAVFGRALGLLPWEERRAQVDKYRFSKDRCLSLGAGLLAAHALRDAGATDLRLGYMEYGKPYLAHCPNIHFNLSHSGTMALCAVANQPVGADVEEPQTYDDAMAHICFSDDELLWIRGHPNMDWAFTRMWVRKESYLKLVGTGLTDDVRSCSVTPHAKSGSGVHFWEYEILGYAVCACVRREANVAFRLAEPQFWASV